MGITLLLPLILIVGMIWFISRTQRKQRQRQADTVAALEPGTKVVTTSGVVGIVEEVDDEYVTLEISEGVLVQFVKAAVGRVVPEDDDHADDHADETARRDRRGGGRGAGRGQGFRRGAGRRRREGAGQVQAAPHAHRELIHPVLIGVRRASGPCDARACPVAQGRI